jgi:hypothetical protein
MSGRSLVDWMSVEKNLNHVHLGEQERQIEGFERIVAVSEMIRLY